MWFFIVKSIIGGILGSATAKWFETTAVGIWFYAKMSQLYDWAAKRYDLKILEVEEQWKKKYPNIARRIDELEKQISDLQPKNRLFKVKKGEKDV
tara:strand:+ start:457 stop:741 length:285 start_codon:yes stop_codon:yes gene_type:complete